MTDDDRWLRDDLHRLAGSTPDEAAGLTAMRSRARSLQRRRAGFVGGIAAVAAVLAGIVATLRLGDDAAELRTADTAPAADNPAPPSGPDQASAPAGPPPGDAPPAAPAAAAPRPAGGGGGGSLSQAAVTSAWGPLLDALSQKVRARFKGGRITTVDPGSITFGVPNAIARDRCLQVSADLEAALAQHFGQPVQVHVVIDDQASAPIDVARIEPRPVANAPSDLDEDVGPVSELVDATDQSANGIDRLTKAFPGSEVIDA